MRKFFLSLGVNSCAGLLVPDHTPLPPFACMARTHICVHVKDPISICCKRVCFTAGGVVTKILHTGEEKKKKKLGSAVQWLLTFPGEKNPYFLCIALRQEMYLIHMDITCPTHMHFGTALIYTSATVAKSDGKFMLGRVFIMVPGHSSFHFFFGGGEGGLL